MNWMDYVPKLPRLAEGAHDEESGLMCAAEMVAFLERLPHSDSPECTCPVILAYVRVVNDNMDDDSRQMLLPYLPRLVDTVSHRHEQARAEAIAMHAVHHIVPAVMHGIIPEPLVAAMRSAETLDAGVYAASRAGACAAARAAHAADCAVEISAGHAAHAARAARAAARAVDLSADLSEAYAAAHAAANAAHAAARAADLLSEAEARDEFGRIRGPGDDLSEACAAGFSETCAAAYSAARAAGFSAARADDGGVEIWPLALEGLERMLAIGPQGKTTFDKERVEELIHTA